MKQFLKQTVPIALLIGITVVMSFFLYRGIMTKEEENCWNLLRDSSDSVTKEMRITLTDDINLLRLAADMLAQDAQNGIDPSAPELYRGYTTFSRVDLLLPDGSAAQSTRQDLSFDSLAQAGEHMSARMTDPATGKDTVCYFLPVQKDGQTVAVLVGVLECTALSSAFHPTIYDGNASFCMVDAKDGNYIMDAWHDTLGNAYTTPTRPRLKGYEQVDLKAETRAQKTGVIAFESRTTGKPLYMYYTPLGMFDWELMVFVPEDVAFARLIYIRRLLIRAGISEAVLVLLYFFWNLRQIRNLRKSRAETLRQLHISNTLLECVTALSSDRDIDAAIQNLLRVINGYFQADRTHIFLRDPKKDVFIDTYEYDAPQIRRQMPTMPQIPAAMLAGGMQAFRTSGVYYIPDIEQEKETANYALFKGRDISRLLAVPLCENAADGEKGEVTGFVSVDNPRRSYDDATILSSIQFFISNSLATKKYQDQLRFMSYWDALTSLYNRNGLIRALAVYRQKTLFRVGAIYLDLNGLKCVNDLQGHEAGDALIRAAARTLGEIYPDNAYRIGGDEFAVLVSDIPEEVFAKKTRTLREALRRQDIGISLGAVWQAKCADPDALLKEADRRMYAEKSRHNRENAAPAKDAPAKNALAKDAPERHPHQRADKHERNR